MGTSDEKKVNKSRRYDYIEWCKKNGITKAFTQYENGLRAIEKHYSINIDDQFEKDSCEELLKKIKNDKDVIFAKKQAKSNLRNWVSYLSKYIEYKKNFNLKTYDNVEKEIENNNSTNQNISNNIKCFLHSNTIFYGVPGCGKSYFIKNLLKIRNNQNEEIELDKKFYKRILFHPEYTYSDFIGQTMPVVNKENKEISYKFVPGPFAKILKTALGDSNNHYFLIIEEINRGNAPAIFGDIFQLLDRDENGKSEYEIDNDIILDYLNREDENDNNEKIKAVDVNSVYIPSNLTIFATMNTCDQNVFTLDTAFKRRWRMTRIKNDFNNSDDEFLTDDHNISFENGLVFTWKEFAIALNDAILNNCDDGMIAEDKLLGTHFVKESDLGDTKVFAEKVLLYLWNDVVKYNKNQLFKNGDEYNTLDKIIEKFINGENVFNDGCDKIISLYRHLDENAE